MEKRGPIGGIRVVVVGNGAKPEFLLDALDLHNALMQSLRMLRRAGFPVAERFARDGHERRAKERWIGNRGSAEKEKPVRTCDYEGRIAWVSADPYAGE